MQAGVWFWSRSLNAVHRKMKFDTVMSPTV